MNQIRFAILFLFFLGQGLWAGSKEFTLTLLHDNDLHGHLLPFPYTEKGVGSNENPSVGGAARRATLIRKLRSEIKNPVLLLNAGDAFTRGPLTTTYQGQADIAAMNVLGYDAACIGNNEFKARDAADDQDASGAQKALLAFVKNSRFPWLCANALDSEGNILQGVRPFTVLKAGNIRVGILGLTAPRTMLYPQVKGWKILDPFETAKIWIPKARAECDILIALTHIGRDFDMELASQTSGLDAIVGGDTHTFLYRALEVTNTEATMVPIVQAGEFGVRLGRFDLHFTRDEKNNWLLTNYQYALLPVDQEIAEASDVASALEPFMTPFREVVGHLEAAAETPQGRRLQTSQILVDALREQMETDLSFIPVGDGLFETLRNKSIIRYDIFSVFPFHNNAAVARLSGGDIQKLLVKYPKMAASGDTNRLETNSVYRVALLDFTAHFKFKLPAESIQGSDRDVRDLVIAYLRKKK